MCGNEVFELKDRLTVLVNSCDSYEDLWFPFFILFRKYWEDKSVRLLLNTETKSFSMTGLDIECIQCNERKYGARMLNALSKVNTEYVLILLDDFFLRRTVDLCRIREIIQWMDEDRDIAYFNSDCTNVYADWEVDKYPGFRRIPPGSEYVLNLQAAIWRTDVLKKYWKPDISPWEWEEFSNILTTYEKKYKFYCTTAWENAFCDYGYKPDGMGVFRGRWVVQDVKPLFEKENIEIDFSIRGYYEPNITKRSVSFPSRKDWNSLLLRCFGMKGLFLFYCYRVQYKIARMRKKEMNNDFFSFMRGVARKRFLRQVW